MKKLAVFLAVFIGLSLLACNQSNAQPTTSNSVPIPWPAGLPKYDHIVIVVEENKDYDDIIGNDSAKYINDTLKKEGASFTRMFGEEHNSQGNYFWLFSGSNQDIGFNDAVPDGQPFTTA